MTKHQCSARTLWIFVLFSCRIQSGVTGNGREGIFKAMRESLMDPDGCTLPSDSDSYFWTSMLNAASPATWLRWEWLKKESRWRGTHTHSASQDGAAVSYMCWTRQPQRQNLYDVSRLMDTADRQRREEEGSNSSREELICVNMYHSTEISHFK